MTNSLVVFLLVSVVTLFWIGKEIAIALRSIASSIDKLDETLRERLAEGSDSESDRDMTF
ncbi:MAG: hypothetical protein MPN21_08490 [Thermoanaerobaculia bacterium]|nr:hypothetical protein [Thermoanaerobaculia bacterium]